MICKQVLQFNINNAITLQLFVYIRLNDPIVLFQTIQFRIDTQFQCQTLLFDP